jgi:hypothetical protein
MRRPGTALASRNTCRNYVGPDLLGKLLFRRCAFSGLVFAGAVRFGFHAPAGCAVKRIFGRRIEPAQHFPGLHRFAGGRDLVNLANLSTNAPQRAGAARRKVAISTPVRRTTFSACAPAPRTGSSGANLDAFGARRHARGERRDQGRALVDDLPADAGRHAEWQIERDG